jgi:hypothetical protein
MIGICELSLCKGRMGNHEKIKLKQTFKFDISIIIKDQIKFQKAKI